LSSLANDIEHKDTDDDGIQFSHSGVPVIKVAGSGRIVVNCAPENRNATSAAVTNMVLRPLALQVIATDSKDMTGQWYLTDGNEYKVKLLDEAEVSGPKHLEALASDRAQVLRDLLEADALYADLRENQSVNAVNNAVLKLNKLCSERGWEKPRFHFDKIYHGPQLGYVFKMALPQFGIEIASEKQNWDEDFHVARNKVALKALKTLETLANAANTTGTA